MIGTTGAPLAEEEDAVDCGTEGNGDLLSRPGAAVLFLCLALAGVDGYADRSRGVSLMTSSECAFRCSVLSSSEVCYGSTFRLTVAAKCRSSAKRSGKCNLLS